MSYSTPCKPLDNFGRKEGLVYVVIRLDMIPLPQCMVPVRNHRGRIVESG